jgi:hypothetical protein
VSAEKPKLRNDLDFMPVQSDGKMLVLIRDRLGISKQDRVVSPELYGIMTMLDGSQIGGKLCFGSVCAVLGY